MTADISSFADMMSRLRNGDADAFANLFQRYAGRLIALARRRLGPLVNGKVDPEDVVQSALKSFFLRQVDGRLTLQSWDGLWAMLTTITLRKCGHQLDYLYAARRDVRREVAPRATDLSDDSWNFLADDPTPYQAAVMTETVEHLLAGLEGCHCDIFRLALEGYSSAEIAERVEITERTVQRSLKRVRDRLQRMIADPPAGV